MNTLSKILRSINMSVVTCIVLISTVFLFHFYYIFSTYLTWGVVVSVLCFHILSNRKLINFHIPPKVKWFSSALVFLGLQVFLSQYLNNKNLVLSAVYLLKFFTLSLVVTLLYLSQFTFRDIEKALFFYICLFSTYYAIGLFFPQLGLVWREGSGRVSSYLVSLGELFFVGIFFSLYGLSKFLFKISFKNLFIYCLGVILIGLDGSRSGVVFIIFSTLLGIFINKNKFYKIVLYSMFMIFIIYTCINTVARDYAGGPNLTGRFSGGISTFKTIIFHTKKSTEIVKQTPVSGGIKVIPADSNDSVRTKMIILCKEIIMNATFFGGGIGKSSIVYNNETFVLHNAYVQVLGDYGYIGFLLFISIYIIQFSMIPFSSINKKFSYLFMFLVATIQPVVVMFHPLSNEITSHLFLFLILIVLFKKYEKEQEPVAQIA